MLMGRATARLQVYEKAGGETLPQPCHHALSQILPSQAATNPSFAPKIVKYYSSLAAPHPSHPTHVLATVPRGRLITWSGLLCYGPEDM